MKNVTYNLQQFHEMPEKNEMMGNGFTEWLIVKRIKFLFDGIAQLFDFWGNEYDVLLDCNLMRKLAKIANGNGAYDFVFLSLL